MIRKARKAVLYCWCSFFFFLLSFLSFTRYIAHGKGSICTIESFCEGQCLALNQMGAFVLYLVAARGSYHSTIRSRPVVLLMSQSRGTNLFSKWRRVPSHKVFCNADRSLLVAKHFALPEFMSLHHTGYSFAYGTSCVATWETSSRYRRRVVNVRSTANALC